MLTATQQPIDLSYLIAEEIKKLSPGLMAFNPPKDMHQGDKVRIDLRIKKIVAGEETPEAEKLQESFVGQNEPIVLTSQVGTLMKAELSGDGFEILPLSEEEQFVSNDSYTEWAWEIKAIKVGQQFLNLSTTVKIIVPEYGEKERNLPVETYTVIVHISPGFSIGAFIGKYWQWLTTIILIPIIASIWRLYSARKAEKKKRDDVEKNKLADKYNE